MWPFIALAKREAKPYKSTVCRLVFTKAMDGATGFELSRLLESLARKDLENQQSSQRDLGQLRTHPYICA
jgi:hypothetical protein